MYMKAIGIATIAGGFILLVLSFIADAIAQLITPYDIFSIGGVRAMDDPVMGLFFSVSLCLCPDGRTGI